MKKTLLFIAYLFITLSAAAMRPSAENKDFVESLVNFFAVRGIDATYDISDNSLNFKINGNSYWVCVNNDKAPFLIDFHKEGVLMRSNDREADMLKKCNYVNCEVLAGKAFLKEAANSRRFVNFTTQYYVIDRKEFVEVFNKSIETLDLLESTYKSYTQPK